jgi:hypothetical protein
MDKEASMTNNHKRYQLEGLMLVALIALASIFLMLLGCTTPKATQRKDDKAVARVLANDKLLARVGKRINLGGDTVIIEKTTVLRDTLRMPAPERPQDCEECILYVNSLVFAITEPIDTTLPNGVTLSIGPWGIKAGCPQHTSKSTIRDRSEAYRWQDSAAQYKIAANMYRHEADILSGHILQLEAKSDSLAQELIIAQQEKDVPKKGLPWWLLIVFGILIGLGLGFFVGKKTGPLVLLWGIVSRLIKKKDRK